MSVPAWTDARLAAALFAVDPGTGGIRVRARPGPVRDRYLALLCRALPPGTPVRRLPLHVGDDRLLGGLDLTATLRAGRPVATRGLLAETDGGVVVVAMAERVSGAVAARIAAVLDSGELVAERDGQTLRSRAAIGVVALDEGIADDEQPPAALLDRLAFRVDLAGIAIADAGLDAGTAADDAGRVQAARALLPSVTVPDAIQEALCAAAAALGVGSMRALLLAVRAARAAAALDGRQIVAEANALAAARLVFAPRATALPAVEPPPDAGEQEPGGEDRREPDGSGTDASPDSEGEAPAAENRPIGEVVLEAAKAAIPPDLLARLMTGKSVRARTPPSAGRAGAPQQAGQRGRPIGVRRGRLAGGARLNLVETLRAAAPWQPSRRRDRSLRGDDRPGIVVVEDDFRVVRFRQRSETTTIFLVDASGSAALARLAEAKGAVELLLADCYVRRDRVALIAFRGTGAEMLLPPTTSLVRAKRSLAALPGGGGTPLAAGLDAGFALAEAMRRKGQSPVLVLLSDGRANVARDGTPGRPRAEEDAVAAGRMLRGAGISCVLVDTSPRPGPQARQLADAMGALYLPLPYADAASVSRAVIASRHG